MVYVTTHVQEGLDSNVDVLQHDEQTITLINQTIDISLV